MRSEVSQCGLARIATLLLVIAVLLNGCATSDRAPERPNFVFFLVDDMGWADVGVNGSTFYETPNIDRLAGEGMQFTDAYAACPVCSPTRASIMTGKYPARINLTDWIPGRQSYLLQEPGNRLQSRPFELQMALEDVTIAEALAEAGYRTFFAGKWHLGGDSLYWPEAQGFEINKGGHDRGQPPAGYFSPYRNPRLDDGPDGEYLTDRLGDEAVGFLDSVGNDPFLLYLSFYTVHNPMQGINNIVDRYQEKSARLGITEEERFSTEAEWIDTAPERGNFRERLVQDHPVYSSMVESLDENVGRVLAQLEDLGLEENTVVIFMSDNGGLSTSEGSPTVNGPLRAGKGWLYEGGVREPMFIKWPGVTRAGSVSEDPVTSTDFYPTMLEMAGLSLRPEQHRDGVSIVPLLREARDFDRGPIFWHYPHFSNQGGRPGGAIRQGDFKLIEFFEQNSVELYNLREDIGERHDLSEEMPVKTEALRQLLRIWRQEVDATMMDPNPIFDPDYRRR